MAEKNRWRFSFKKPSRNKSPIPVRKPKIQEKHSLDPNDVESIMQLMLMGSELCKIRSYTRRYERKFMIDTDRRKFFYLGSQKHYCLKPETCISFREMHEIRRGWKTDTFNKLASKNERATRRYQKFPSSHFPINEACCFSIIYGPRYQSLDLICPSEKVCNEWVRGLAFILARHKSHLREDARDEWIKKMFLKADGNRSGTLSFDECLVLLEEMNIEMEKEAVKTIFKKCIKNKHTRNGVDALDAEDFLKFYKILDSRPELEDIFEKYSGSTSLWGATELQAFLVEEQNVREIPMNWITDDIATNIIKRFEPDNYGSIDYMTLEGFKSMMKSEEMDIYNYDHQQTVYQDMSRPLNHYYIATSHNTYLTANQLTSNSSIEGYIQSLLKGCRCVELDLWDGYENEPKITHGYTLTSDILLKDVLQDAIKPYAFEVSDFPLILTVENHLSEEQQEVAARYFHSILGEYLYTETVTSAMDNLPSPFHLRKKIIIRAKKRKEDISESDEESSAPGNENTEKEKSEIIKRSYVINGEFSELVNICQSVKFHGFSSKEEGKFNESFSISEDQAASLAMTSTSEFIRFTQKHLVKIYPKARRQDSSNFDPIASWNVGCQLVALNYQTNDEYMLYNSAKFKDNGKCGYVLKPEYLNSDVGDTVSTDGLLQLDSTRKSITIKVISGQCLPKPYQGTSDISDPYVEVVIRGHSTDDNLIKTKPVQNNGFNPVWNETFNFTINFWELAFVHFIVYDMNRMKDCKIGEFCLPCTSMLTGYRFIHLFNKHPGSIFVHVKIDDISS